MKQNWSRRELEAFGEPLGDSVTQRKLGGGYILGGGGKGGGGGSPPPAPSSQTVTNTSIPEYARPYVERMLGKAEALSAAPYQSYKGERIAEFSPLQRKVFSNVANQTTAAELDPATRFATQAGRGSMETGGRMGLAGSQYEQMATDPRAMQAYMNPYIQQSLDPQLRLLQQQGDLQSLAQQGAATRAGAFGGSRAALANALAQQNSLMAQQQAIGQGYNTAFQNAQQAQQFRSNLGLQGLQGQLAGYGQAGQAAAALGQLGQTRFGQQQAINAAQQQVGAVQQAQAQQALDMAYQDFLKQRNYPYQQLAFMSDMTRGLPLSQASQQIYTAPPSPISQLGGLGMSALGIYGMSGGFKAKGGVIKEMAKGGLAYGTGGDIKMMDTEQLQELLDNPNLTPMEVELIEKQLMLRRRMEMNPQSEEIMQRAGITAIPTGNMVPMEETMAGGGIVAFAGSTDGSLVKDDDAISNKQYREFLRSTVMERLKNLEGGPDPFAESKKAEADIRAQLAERRKTSPWEALTMAGLGTMAGTSRYGLSNLGLGGLEGLRTYGRAMGEEAQMQKELLQQAAKREEAKYARGMQNLNALQTSLGQMDAREIATMNQKASQNLAAATRESAVFQQTSSSFMDKVAKEKDLLRKKARDEFNFDITEDKLEEQAVANVKARLPAKTKKILFGDEDAVPAASTSGQATGSTTTTAAPAAAPAKPASTLGPYEKLPKVATQAEYDKLKPGAKYIDPNGNVRQKKS